MIISKKRNRRRAKNLVIFYNFNGPPNAVSYSLFLSPFFPLPSTKLGSFCRCFCWWRWFSILTLFLLLLVVALGRVQTHKAVSEERCVSAVEKHFPQAGVGDSSKFSTSRKKTFNYPLSPRALVFSVPLLLLFYYLFYDYLKWPIVKVNDNSERHKIAHSILWLLSIIFLSVINWGWAALHRDLRKCDKMIKGATRIY